MKLLFVDETARQENPKKGTFFCICGLVVDDKSLLKVNNELEAIKAKYNLTNLKDLRKSAIAEVHRIRTAREIMECLTKYDIKVRAVIIGGFSMSRLLPKEEIYMGALSFMLERFTFSLKNEKEIGLVMFDGVGQVLEKNIRKKFYEYVRQEILTMVTKRVAPFREYLYPALFFCDDNQSVLIQAVDLIATSLNSAIFNLLKEEPYIKIEELPSKNKFLEIYWPLFMRSGTCKVEGWGIKIWN